MISLTALGQRSSTDSVTISRDQQRQCITWYKENQIKDSIIILKDSIILNQDQFIEETDARIQKIDSELSETRQSLQKMKKKRRNAWIVGGFSTILSAVLTFFVTK